VADRSVESAWSLLPAAQELSARHRIIPGSASPLPAWSEARATASWLHDIRIACTDPPPEAGKAAEWLLDNDYQIHRALRQIRQDLPASFYDRLPALECGVGRTVPRIFPVAHDLIRVTRLQISLAGAVRFIRAYQKRAPLTIAELWAFPTMLRIACLEVVVSAITPFFAGRVAMPFEPSAWALERHSIDDTERVARGIANLGLIAAIPWEDFFDQVSLVEEALRADPSGDYGRMDFETRDRYRRAIEDIADRGSGGEIEVAAEALRRAGAAGEHEAARHVGHWLIGDGRRRIEPHFHVRLPFSAKSRRYVLDRPGLFYALALVGCCLGALILPVFYLIAIGAGLGGAIAALLATLIPASILAVALVHGAVTRLVPPRVLPKLNCGKGLPADCPTLVTVPVVIASIAEVPGLVEQLQTHWLANADPRLQIVLLADPADAPTESIAGDAELAEALDARIAALNKRHGKKGVGPFHLLLRPRRFNPAQGCWMAWERKRGKLEQFNRLLIEGDDGGFSLHIGNREALNGTRFIVTVDADTMLPPGSVARLVGTLAHPLNRPRFDASTGRISSGYSIIQPRTEISPQSGTRTTFARLFTGETAIDIYSRAVSDVYQDLFGTGIFVGKGIYDLHAFHRSVDGRVPDNSILSHDLFEGAHGRVALATDIVLYEGFPSTYLEYGRRLHRWIRGDWQLLPWLRRSVPAVDGSRLLNAFHAIDRWKILDNLRRSLVAPSMLLLALAGWLILPGRPWFWTLLAVLAPAGQLFTDLVSGLARGRRRGAVRGLFEQLADQAGRWLLAIVYLMHEALLSLHAILITLWRVYVSHRNLLEWSTAAHVAARLRGGRSRAGIWRRMWLGPFIAASAALALWYVRPESLPAAMPLLLLWIAAPEFTFRIGNRRKEQVESLDASDAAYLRGLARRTWFFFETFAGPEDNWLPPDNYQGEPHEEIAHRTSPTNIGMMLLSTATAWDLGYLGRAELSARTAAIFESLDRLERYRGHFLNWYDTETLKPLEPRYVSAVDSGNLAVSLIAFGAALREASAAVELEPQRWEGLIDVVDLLGESLSRLRDPPAMIVASVAELKGRLRRDADDPTGWAASLGEICHIALPVIEARIAETAQPASGETAARREIYVWMDRLSHQARAMLRDLDEKVTVAAPLRELADKAAAIAERMNFRPLYDAERRLFFIGYNVSSGRTDLHRYDLLASEARLASFFAIAKGDVPLEHWFHLERPVTRAAHGLTLLSWNGSMFEYLMPRLLLKSGPETLLGESERIAVEVQRLYGASRNVPWGISESAYAARDPEHRYRYQAFGVPALGLRRGLARDMVVAPYASALALAVAPGRAAANLRVLDRLTEDKRFGLVEAIDFTADRAGPAQRFTPVNAHMAHHQGMILCAIGNALKDDILVRRFAREPRMRLISLLLSERIPKEVPSEIERIEELDRPTVAGPPLRVAMPWSPPALAPFPQLNLLGNGRLSSWISDGGGGCLRWHRKALTRFLPDATRDPDGLWIYVADEENGALWSATRQPTGTAAEEYHATFHGHAAEFQRRDNGIRLRLEVAVAAGDDLEIRRLNIVNESGRPRRLRLTSYGEVVLAPPLEDERHPAFSKLFVVGEPLPKLGGLLFTRRPRSSAETPPVLLHVLIGSEGPVEGLRFECDRRAFIGRGRDLRRPAGASNELGNSSGATLDSVMALQTLVELQPFEQRELCFVTMAAASREAAIEVAERYATLPAIDWALGDSASACAHAVERLRLDPEQLAPLHMLASLLVHPHSSLRGNVASARANKLGQSNLWGLAISGDHPILLLRTSAGGDPLLGELIGAHTWWRRQGLDVDLVILQTGGSAYIEPIRDDVVELLRDRGIDEMLGRSGGIHLVFADQIGPQQVRLLEATARVVLDGGNGSLDDQLAAALETRPELPRFAPSLDAGLDGATAALERPADLLFDNGVGGFTPEGREYVIHLEAGETTPAPWSNILANDLFGCLVTEAGGGFSWAINSGENRLTPWTNDPVLDRPVETLYLRDEETAAIWSATPAPAARGTAFEIRHGAGYSLWRSRAHGIEQEMLVFVPIDAPVKIVRLRIRNLLKRHRRLTATYLAEWLLGALPSLARQHVVCSYDAAAHALLARSWWNFDFAGRTAFLTASLPPHGLTTSLQEFLGREGDPALPAGLARCGLSGEAGAGNGDACAAYQVHLELAPDGSEEVVFVLGQGEDEREATALARQWAGLSVVQAAFDRLESHWDALLGAVEVHTPDPGFDIIVNRWLLYQSLSSRILARTGFYQSSGAIGYRDQLQDVLALLHADPGRARAHILQCAAHQFGEGDVLHWWHPPSGRGVRTRCSDDLLWLPYAVGTYVGATGDASILAEEIAFLDAPPLAADEEDRYARYELSARRMPLIDHCERALEQGLTQGSHGLPLIGSGDWNDGMDRVGRGGRGESVWLAWFAAVAAGLMADVDRRLGRDQAAERWATHARTLRERAEASGWDGGWYRRAFDDDGHPLGSAENDECRIDSISQSWAAFAEADPERVRTALAAASQELLDPDAGLARLLWPPFADTPRDPGYIKAYPPGVRENGGQYSHAAAWLGLAFARAGQADDAMRVFDMLNPIGRATDRAKAEHYRVEPYAVAGDIASAGPLRGRGGWTWYTGAASWTWRLAVEGILGIGLHEGRLVINPCIKSAWGGFEAVLRRPGGSISLKVVDPDGRGSGPVVLTVDGVAFQGLEVEFPADGGKREVVARIGK